jgi:hypothetical protein
MAGHPKSDAGALLGPRTVLFVLAGGAVLGSLTVATLMLYPERESHLAEARTTAFLLLVFGHLLYALPARRVDGHPRPNPVVYAAIASGAALQVVALAVPVLREALNLAPVPALAVAWAFGAAAIAWAFTEGAAWLLRSRAPSPLPANPRPQHHGGPATRRDFG